MEECSTSLGNLLEERHEDKLGPLPVNQMKKVCHDLCEALAYLHDTVHLLHGDIKSFNVSVCYECFELDFETTSSLQILIKNDFEICKLCDFGVSLPLNADGYIDLIKKPDAKYVGELKEIPFSSGEFYRRIEICIQVLVSGVLPRR